jgi:membrane protein YqaA with SNARE-associated domain
MLRRNSAFKAFFHNLKGHHTENIRKGLYGYMWWSALKIIFIYILVIVPVILIARQLIDLNLLFQYIFKNHSDGFVVVVFFVSECFLGMIPPDLFVIWSSKFSTPTALLALLGILSYIGGAISYLIGYWLSKRPGIKAYSEHVLKKYILLVRKWGGAFIIIAALFPFSPFSMVIIAVSLLKYPFRLYLLFGITRIARFLVQGVLYLDILNMGSFFSSLN